MTPVYLSPVLSPHGRLGLEHTAEAPPLDEALARRLEVAFARGAGHGLLHLGAAEIATALPPVFSYWRELGKRYVTVLCTRPEAEDGGAAIEVPAPAEADLESLAAAAPPMTGAEYLTAAVLSSLWLEIDAARASEMKGSRATIEAFLKRLDPSWNVVGRVHFNLAERPRDAEAPFAFLATYTTGLSAHGAPLHRPLGEALREYAGAKDRARLLSLLLPVERAAANCPWLQEMVASGEIYHPLRWDSREAYRLLLDVPLLESAAVVVRTPTSWGAKRPSRPQVQATVGKRAPSALGADALLDFDVGVSLDGERLSAEEVRELLAGSGGLAFLRGRWVEVDRDRLARMIERFEEVERTAKSQGLAFAEAMRMLAGAEIGKDAAGEPADADWAQVVAGPWLRETLQQLRAPGGRGGGAPPPSFRGTLRPYQEVGVRWLSLLARLGLGACLADDMGLGKTIQVLALLLSLDDPAKGPRSDSDRTASVLVAPASLLSNWASEIEKFAPTLKAVVAHPSAMSPDDLAALAEGRLGDWDLVITSYGCLLRFPWLSKKRWRLAILDEAQAIKNPGAKQTRAAKALDARARIALTGTPVENRLSDLWSIFDFVNPGLLGSAKEFSRFVEGLSGREENPYGPLRDLVRPYILRRLKTDKSVISDLPDKTEVTAYCPLTKKQAALYQRSVEDLKEALEDAEGIARRGVVLASLMRFKQICNHPSQWLGDAAWAEADSGKWGRLRELVEVIAAKQEKVLVFTQFREMTAPLAAFLGSVFGRPGLVLHGGTPVGERRALVKRFQEDEAVPFFVLSLKAGGSGLNLTAASHVIHFDRWWNAAVENQATDRAFRIGQKRNVLVHKFVCRGTVEERIDDLIESKRRLSKDLLEGDAGVLLTELNDEEILGLVALDIHAALKEG